MSEPLRLLEGGRRHRYEPPAELKTLVQLVLCLAVVGLVTLLTGLALLLAAAVRTLL